VRIEKGWSLLGGDADDEVNLGGCDVPLPEGAGLFRGFQGLERR